ncbi:MAG TPA: hypothetical protein VGE27_17240 [Gemmatimonas sp.]
MLPAVSVPAQSLKLSAAKVLLTDEDESGLTLLQNTRLAVHESGALALGATEGWVGVYDPAKQDWRRIGRKGRGPNEYIGPLFVGWLADTLWIQDHGTFRVTAIAARGTSAPKSSSFSFGRLGDFQVVGTRAWLAGGGALAAMQPIGPASRWSDAVKMQPVIFTDRQAVRLRDTLFIEDRTNATLWISKNDVHLQGRQPFNDGTIMQVSGNGRFLARVEQATHARARRGPLNAIVPARLELWEFSSGRRSVRHSTTLSASAPLPKTEFDAWLKEQLRSQREYTGRLQMQFTEADYRKATYIPDSRPQASDIVVANDGSILIRQNSYTTNTAAYRWFDSAGKLRGTFTTPLDQNIRVLQGDRIWSILKRDDDTFAVTMQDIRP